MVPIFSWGYERFPLLAYCMVFLPIRQASELLTRVSQQQQQMQDPINSLKPCQPDKLLNKQLLWGVLTQGPPHFLRSGKRDLLKNLHACDPKATVKTWELQVRNQVLKLVLVGGIFWIYIYMHTHIFSCSSWYFGEMIYLIQFALGIFFKGAAQITTIICRPKGVMAFWPQREPPQKAGLWGFANNDQCIQCSIILMIIVGYFFLFLFISLIIVVIWCVIYHREIIGMYPAISWFATKP